MNLIINKSTSIYILAPAWVATWGPELLHQLSFKIKKILWHEKVFIYYMDIKEDWVLTNENYKQYWVKISKNIQDDEDNILIVPEIYTKELKKYNNIRKVIWWLSIDNYYFNINLFYTILNKVILEFFNSQQYFGFNKNFSKWILHFVQSEYANNHLKNKWIIESNIFSLSDYLNSDFLKNEFISSKKENIVAYNPKKWYKFTKKIIDYSIENWSNLKFIPIVNMSRNEVIELLKVSKIYIDLWYFPWKDRIPREASILWCLILISNMWSWNYFQDFWIDNKFKIKKLKKFKDIFLKIENLILNYEENLELQKNYRNIIQKEEFIFDNSIKNIFKIHN